MTFEELRQRLRWACDDGTNSEDLDVLYPNMDGTLINEAIRSLADCLNIVKYSKTVTYSSTGVVTLPSDFKEILRIRYCGVDLEPISDPYSITTSTGTYYNDEDSDDTSADSGITKFMVMGLSNVQLYNTPPIIPTNLTVTPTTAGTDSYGYRINARTAKGTSIICAEVKANADDDDLTNTLTWTAVADAIDYSIYRTTGGTSQGLIGIATTNNFTDTGIDATAVEEDDLLMHLWYKAYPATLVKPMDTPSDIPVEYHPYLAEMYAKAHFMRKKGNYQVYSLLMQEWLSIKKQIKGTMESAADPQGMTVNKWIW